MSLAGTAIEAANVVAGYGESIVLRNVSLAVRPGEMLAIVGPNGAGKSTLLRVLSGALKPLQGSIELFGRSLSAYDRRRTAQALATVAQENTVAFQFSVLEIVLMGRAPHLASFHLETSHDLSLAREALRLFDLTHLAARPIQELSGGERKRVFLARALAQEPRVILLDEPTAFLDLRHVSQIFAIFQKLRVENGLTVVATLHDLNAAATYADRILILKDGVSAGYGAPQEVFTADLLRDVYEVDLQVGVSPSTGALVVYPA